MPASAEELAPGGTVGQEGLPGRELLVSGADTVADGKSPTHITIDFGKEPVPPGQNSNFRFHRSLFLRTRPTSS
jgi:hypothetical protein